ncbi:hypothetical protein HY483_01475 [Candidatus Woesearchaeota archaeon]|nr:hypothetical protein [Candidatus Woesearchaeota archaeon]
MKIVRSVSAKLSRVPLHSCRESLVLHSLKTFANFVRRDSSKTLAEFSDACHNAVDLLVASRHSDPLFRNLYKILLSDVFSQQNISRAKTKLLLNIGDAERSFLQSIAKISSFIEKKVPRGGNVFVTGGDFIVNNALISSFNKKRRFGVLICEERSTLSGRKSAEVLSNSGLSVNFYPDNSLSYALFSADIVFLRTFVLTGDFVVSSPGSLLVAEICNSRGIPVYAVAPVLSYDDDYSLIKSLHNGTLSGFFSGRSKNIVVRSPAFDLVPGGLLTGVITDIGIFPFDALYNELSRSVPELF